MLSNPTVMGRRHGRQSALTILHTHRHTVYKNSALTAAIENGIDTNWQTTSGVLISVAWAADDNGNDVNDNKSFNFAHSLELNAKLVHTHTHAHVCQRSRSRSLGRLRRSGGLQVLQRFSFSSHQS